MKSQGTCDEIRASSDEIFSLCSKVKSNPSFIAVGDFIPLGISSAVRMISPVRKDGFN
ncbi:MAG: hypothetical protein PHH84_08560 [Oscillospiraceae bacterium]|nr:hypothetical protein [Oscillospiraceae bacterium]MDD2362986.1 hypothetical protein [Oscillospiraceae bacterium]